VEVIAITVTCFLHKHATTAMSTSRSSRAVTQPTLILVFWLCLLSRHQHVMQQFYKKGHGIVPTYIHIDIGIA
jgi:hypothetical protein